jgi:hypothetical protein
MQAQSACDPAIFKPSAGGTLSSSVSHRTGFDEWQRTSGRCEAYVHQRESLPASAGLCGEDYGDSQPSGESIIQPIAVTVPLYEPSIDVVAGLPKSVVNKPCDGGYMRGFGNKYLDAARSYYERNIAGFRTTGRDWQEFGMGCTVVETEDDYGRSYFLAFAVAGPWDERLLSYDDWLSSNGPDWLKEDGVEGVGEGPEPSRSIEFNCNDALGHGARAFCPPSIAGQADAFEQPQEAVYRRDATTPRESRCVVGYVSSLEAEKPADLQQRTECPRSVGPCGALALEVLQPP